MAFGSAPDAHRELEALAIASAREAGDWLRGQFGEKIATTPKGDDSIVTELDVASERMIIERIRSVFPDHTIIGEESTPHETAGTWAWAVDPINGTRNFASGIPLWAVSVAALQGGVPVASAIYIPVTGELYHAAAGTGAWLNGRPLQISETDMLRDAVVITDLLARDYPEGLPGARLGGLISAARRTRMFGSVCCALCYVAAGRFDLYYRPRVSLWDVAAGALLVREAGGSVRSFAGDGWRVDSNSILVANRTLVEQFLDEKRRLDEQPRR